MENQLKLLLAQYNEIQKKNNEDSNKIQLMRNLASVFQVNHCKIEEMKKLLYQTENNINKLRTIADDMNNENSKKNEILRKQNISKANVNKHIEHLMNEKKNKEEIVKMKAIYEKRIKTLEEELNELKDKCKYLVFFFQSFQCSFFFFLLIIYSSILAFNSGQGISISLVSGSLLNGSV